MPDSADASEILIDKVARARRGTRSSLTATSARSNAAILSAPSSVDSSLWRRWVYRVCAGVPVKNRMRRAAIKKPLPGTSRTS